MEVSVADRGQPGSAKRGDVAPRGPISADRAVSLGVPQEYAAEVSKLTASLADLDSELAHPMMLARFVRFLGNATEAEAMVRRSAAWREEVNIERIMSEWGAQDENGWHLAPQTSRAALADRHFCGGRLSHTTRDGSPVIVARLGLCDISGIAREGLGDLILNQFIFLLEDTLRAVHAKSVAEKRLALASVVVDISGLSLGIVRHLELPRKFADIMNMYYPDMAGTVAIVNAPYMFETIWKVVSLLLDPATVAKVRILGKAFGRGVEEQCKLDAAILPSFLGGEASETEVPAALPVPARAGASANVDLSFAR